MSVSVVIPAYNAESTLKRALASVLAQTVPAREILVIDDGSRDRTPEIVRDFGDRVRLISQSNAGVSAARNRGVDLAASPWIAFLDADDAWHPSKIERQLAALEALSNAVLCYTGLVNRHRDGTENIAPPEPLATLPEALRFGNPSITPSCVMLSRAAFLQAGGFNPQLAIGEDWALWLALSRLGPFCNVDAPLTFYQVSTTGLSADADRMFLDARRVLDAHLSGDLHGLHRFLWRQQFLSYQNYKAALTARGSHLRQRELAHILSSIVRWPSPRFHPQRFRALAVTLKNLVHPAI